MEIKKTITSIFMVPTLQIPKAVLTSNGFINGYIRDASHDMEYKDSIYLLFQPTKLYEFRDFLENEYERTKQIIEDYDLPNGFVVVVYKLDPVYKLDFDLIRQGKYSKTSPSFQNLFPKMKRIKLDNQYKDEVSLQYRIFNRSQELINFWEKKLEITIGPDQEVWSAFVEKDEILNIDQLQESLK